MNNNQLPCRGKDIDLQTFAIEIDIAIDIVLDSFPPPISVFYF